MFYIRPPTIVTAAATPLPTEPLRFAPFKASAAWFALALIGAAAALQLVEAGPSLHYQHLAPAWALFRWPSLPWISIVIVQAVIVASRCVRRRAALGEWTRGFTSGRLFVGAMLFALSSAAVSADVWRYVTEIPVATFIQTVNLLNIVLIAASFPQDELSRIARRPDNWLGEQTPEHDPQPGGRDRFALGAALFTVIVAAFLSILSYERHPHIPDEVSYILQARYFAKGMIDMPLPPVPGAFNLDLMTYAPASWFSPMPPGWPAVLSVGVLLGVPWLVNPILAGVNVVLTYLLVRELSDRSTARLVVVLLALSPWHLFLAMSFMPHIVMLTFALTAALAIARARRMKSAIWALVGGAAVGATSIVRPLDGMILGFLLGLWLLVPLISKQDFPLRLASVATYGIGGLIVGAIVLPYNKALTGNATVFPVMAYFDKYYGAGSNALGFGANRGIGWGIDPNRGHSLFDALINTNLNVFTLNTDLFGWSTGSLLLIIVCIAAGRWSRTDRLMLAVIVATVAFHALYWFSGGPDFGPRYWSLILIPCLMLTVSGFRVVQRGLAGNRARAHIAVASLCVIALVVYVPWRAIDKYHDYRGMRPDIRQLASSAPFGRSLVLVRGCRHPDYASAATYNPLDLNAGAPVYAWDVDAVTQEQVIDAYKDRPLWIVDGPTITHRGFEVRAGPLTSKEMPGRSDLQNPPTCETGLH